MTEIRIIDLLKKKKEIFDNLRNNVLFRLKDTLLTVLGERLKSPPNQLQWNDIYIEGDLVYIVGKMLAANTGELHFVSIHFPPELLESPIEEINKYFDEAQIVTHNQDGEVEPELETAPEEPEGEPQLMYEEDGLKDKEMFVHKNKTRVLN